jgi:hypothetical protein
MNLQPRAIETASLEQRVAKLEKPWLRQREILEDNTKEPVLEWGDLPECDQAPPKLAAEEGTKANG